jgi:hypothetical protein
MKLSSESLRPPDIMNAHIWKGNKDFSVNFYRGWNDKFLFLAFEVFDDVPSSDFSGRLIYKNDCVQIALDPKCDAKPGEEYNGDDSEIGLSLTPKGKEIYCWKTGGSWRDGNIKIPFNIKRTPDRTVYEIALPYKLLANQPENGNVFKACFVVFDRDGKNESTRWIELSRGIAGGKNPSAFRTFFLEGKKQ